VSEEHRNWIKEAEDYLNDKYQETSRVLHPELTPSTLEINPALDKREAEHLMRGVEEQFFSIDDRGYVQSMFLPPPSGKNTRQKMLQLFWAKKNGRGLFREGVCQLATVSSLVFEYGWNDYQIAMEPGIAHFGHLAYAVDIIIRDKTIRIIVCGEVKRDHSEFEYLVKGFRYCCNRGPHAKKECKFPKNHAKYEFCSAIRPLYFFAVAPGTQLCFKLTFNTAGAGIQEERGSLISRSEVEDSLCLEGSRKRQIDRA
jgi:hypothetical protein